MKRLLLLVAVVAALLVLGGLAGCGGTDTTALLPSSTATTLPPGAMTFATLVDRFERLVNHENLAGTLPFSLLCDQEVAWLFDPAVPFRVTDARGYRFANGDLVFLFFLTAPTQGWDAESAAREFARVTHARFGTIDSGVWAYSDEQYGYAVVSKQYREDLGRLAQWARTAHQLLIPE